MDRTLSPKPPREDGLGGSSPKDYLKLPSFNSNRNRKKHKQKEENSETCSKHSTSNDNLEQSGLLENTEVTEIIGPPEAFE